jgi:hypothetical protein
MQLQSRCACGGLRLKKNHLCSKVDNDLLNCLQLIDDGHYKANNANSKVLGCSLFY